MLVTTNQVTAGNHCVVVVTQTAISPATCNKRHQVVNIGERLVVLVLTVINSDSALICMWQICSVLSASLVFFDTVLLKHWYGRFPLRHCQRSAGNVAHSRR